MEYTLIIKGFTSKEQIQSFLDWYENEGEDDASLWLSDLKEKGKSDVDWLGLDLSIPRIEVDNTITVQIKPL